jgi:hypothetical protein
MRIVNCKKCGKDYKIGYTGTVKGCDKCLKIQRDTLGTVWHPGEKEHIYLDMKTGKAFSMTRKEAFKYPRTGKVKK